MFSILDGRNKLYQWDLDRKLIVNDKTITEIHFDNGLCTAAPVCLTYEKDGAMVADIPNELLTEFMDIRVWGYDSGMTKHEQVFKVKKKKKPADYVYTPTEVWTAEKAVADALEEAKASGDFKGDKGDKGDAGAIDFIVVNELPAIGDSSKIYLLPEADGEEPNRFGEYVFIEGAWERIGSAGVEVNLDEYVKNTDYATSNKAGLIKANSNQGFYIDINGSLSIVQAQDYDFTTKTNKFRPVTANNLDLAVKTGVTINTIELTDEEKATACAWLGVSDLIAELTAKVAELEAKLS